MQLRRYPYSMKKSRELTLELFEELKELKDINKYIVVETSGIYPGRVIKFMTSDLIDKLVIIVTEEMNYRYNNSCVLKSALLAANNNNVDFEIIFKLNDIEDKEEYIKNYKNLIDEKYITIE